MSGQDSAWARNPQESRVTSRASVLPAVKWGSLSNQHRAPWNPTDLPLGFRSPLGAASRARRGGRIHPRWHSSGPRSRFPITPPLLPAGPRQLCPVCWPQPGRTTSIRDSAVAHLLFPPDTCPHCGLLRPAGFPDLFYPASMFTENPPTPNLPPAREPPSTTRLGVSSALHVSLTPGESMQQDRRGPRPLGVG